MAGLQRSAVSFRRQGSSGLVWDDKLLSGELNQQQQQQQQLPINQREDIQPGSADDNNNNNKPSQEMIQAQAREVKDEVGPRVSPRTVGSIERSRSNGSGPRYRTGRVSPALEPPSPKVSACGFCTCRAFGKQQEKTLHRPPKHAGKRKM